MTSNKRKESTIKENEDTSIKTEIEKMKTEIELLKKQVTLLSTNKIRMYNLELKDIIKDVSQIHLNKKIREVANKYGLTVTTIAWEDTSRYKDSCFGRNISDLSIAVKYREEDVMMSIIKKENFTDKTVDVPIDNFQVTVGNQSHDKLRKISLKEYIKYIDYYTGTKIDNMLLDRDRHVLVSVQFQFLPVGSDVTEFNPKIYNYQNEGLFVF